MEWQTVVSDPFQENTYIAYVVGRDDCLVFDPGLEPDKTAACLKKIGRTPVMILNTHGHSDHIAGNGFLKREYPGIPLVIGNGDAEKLTDPEKNLSGPFGLPLVSPPADQLVGEGDWIDAAGIRLEVRETPGHSAGHVVFVCHEQQPIVVFGGDVLFAGSVGRTDFPDGSMEDLVRSIHGKLFTLPDETIVLPGHGPATTTGREKRSNPFL